MRPGAERVTHVVSSESLALFLDSILDLPLTIAASLDHFVQPPSLHILTRTLAGQGEEELKFPRGKNWNGEEKGGTVVEPTICEILPCTKWGAEMGGPSHT